jgi:signal-transduction protein with cAMP-binding, CBS, and nucleotidyltransferase domain
MTPVCETVVADVAIDPIVRVSSQATLVDLVRVLAHVAAGIVVVESEELAIVTEHDVVVALAEGQPADTPAAEIAHDGMLAVPPSTPLTVALDRMLHAGVLALVVVDAPRHRLGLVTLHSVIGALAAPMPWVGALQLALHLEREQR